MGLSRAAMRYKARAQHRNNELRARIAQLAAERRRFGYQRIHTMLRREGVRVIVKRVHRLYRTNVLQVRRRRKRRGGALKRRPLLVPCGPDEV